MTLPSRPSFSIVANGSFKLESGLNSGVILRRPAVLLLVRCQQSAERAKNARTHAQIGG